MEVSDEIFHVALQAALKARYGKSWDMMSQQEREVTTSLMIPTIRAAIAVMPDQYRAGWLAGRDATESHALTCSKQHEIVPAWVAEMILGIRGLEPPA